MFSPYAPGQVETVLDLRRMATQRCEPVQRRSRSGCAAHTRKARERSPLGVLPGCTARSATGDLRREAVGKIRMELRLFAQQLETCADVYDAMIQDEECSKR